MKISDHLSHFAHSFPFSLGSTALRYDQAHDRFAIHGTIPPELSSSVLEYLNDPPIAILQVDKAKDVTFETSSEITPVYLLEGQNSSAVPTGRIFIRFEENTQADKNRQALEGLGYQILDIPKYALHTAWVRDPTDIATSLTNISKLHSIPNVCYVEPQMLKALGYRKI